MVEELGLSAFAALKQLAVIIRGADTARPELAPQAARPSGPRSACPECTATIWRSWRMA